MEENQTQTSFIHGSFNGDFIKNNTLAFNGIGDNSHETFVMQQDLNPEQWEIDRAGEDNGLFFEFCKTARKPYDVMVCAALIIAKKRFGKYIKIASDGSDEPDMWQEAKEICQNTLGYGARFDFRNGNGIFRRNSSSFKLVKT